jgi:hypothetical protein
VAWADGFVEAEVTGVGAGSTYNENSAKWYLDGVDITSSLGITAPNGLFTTTTADLGLSLGKHTLTVTVTKTSDGKTYSKSVGFEVVTEFTPLSLSAWPTPGVAPVGKVANWNDLQTAINAQITAGATTLDLSNVFGINTFGDGSSAVNLGSVTSVILPNSVKSVAGMAFYNTTIQSVTGTAVTSIGASAFNGCSSLECVNLPAAKSIFDSAFKGCTGLTSVSLPAATGIGSQAFNGCTGLETVDLPAAISIGDYAFYGCSGLTSVDLRAAQSIGMMAFYSTKYVDGTEGTGVTIKLGSVKPTGLPSSLDSAYTTTGTYTKSGTASWTRTGDL